MAGNYGTTICNHIKTFYLVATGEPIVYWSFDSMILGEKAVLVNRLSNTGDICHYDIEKLSHREEKNIFSSHVSNGDLFICNNNGEGPFSVEKLKELIN